MNRLDRAKLYCEQMQSANEIHPGLYDEEVTKAEAEVARLKANPHRGVARVVLVIAAAVMLAGLVVLMVALLEKVS